ncbi:MAG: CehA/McbA family metallohydrolase, partial [Proteobacteria bacterium]|nr:CehA/McbA family metallohydrolase [Pseudomonadota bacterium]
LVVHVHDELGQVIPARLTFVGMVGAHRPRFSHGDVGVDQPGGVVAYDRAFVVGDARIDVPTGAYDVWVSHGMEWDVASRRVQVVAGEAQPFDVTLHHVVDTPGWISGDFHVHAERSNDSRVPMRHRVLQFVADGVDLIVATDHDVIADYAPVIAQLGLASQLTSVRGDEVTTHDWGHFGAFPLAADEGTPSTQPVASKARTPEAIFGELRRRDATTIIDVHHPRLEHGRVGYFHLGELDTATMRSRRAGFSFDFDAIEVLNGYQDPDRRSVDAVLADWFSFLRRGRHVTATGNSDTHHLTFNLGGYPRNYVRLAKAPFDERELAAAIKAGRSYFTTGPIVDVSVGEQGLGDTVSTARAPLQLHVEVKAPAWIDVTRLSVLVDGVVVLRRAIDGVAPLRFAETLTVPITRDAFVIVRVDGDRPMAPMIGDATKFRVYPLAVTNPIWVDVDGDGTVAPSIRD